MITGGINSLMNSYNLSAASTRQMPAVSKIFDYQSSQKNVKSMLDSYKKNTDTVKGLKKDTADFLTQYTKDMTQMNSAASKLTNGGIESMLFDKEGNVTDATIKKTVDATQDMVDSYNKSLKMLEKNRTRGVGIQEQESRMMELPAAREKMAALGISQEKDGTLKLDTEKLTKAFKDPNKLQVKLFSEMLGGPVGVAAGIQKDAQAGMNVSASRLVHQDLAKMQELRASNPIHEMYQGFKAGGAYAMNNQAAAGMLMNMLV